MEAVIKESLRLYPPFPISGRKIEKDIDLSTCVYYKSNLRYEFDLYYFVRFKSTLKPIMKYLF